MSVTTKLGRMVTYNEGNSPIMSHDLLTTGSLEVKLKFFIIVGLGKTVSYFHDNLSYFKRLLLILNFVT